MEGTSSDTSFIISGVPQCSVLGPLLLLIYISDIVYATKHFELLLYADDSTLSSSLGYFNTQSNIVNDINAELEKVSVWLKVNKLSIIADCS